MVGSYVTTLAVGVLVVLALVGGATEVGLVNAAKWLPYLLFWLVAGVLVDRVRPRPLLIAADSAAGSCCWPLHCWRRSTGSTSGG